MRTHLAALATALLAAGCATAPKAEAPSGPPVFPDGLQVKATGIPGQAAATRLTRVGAKVKAIDVQARTITLDTGDGATQTIPVSTAVTDLGALAIGDVIHAEYDQELSLDYQADGAPTVPLQVATAVSPSAGAATAMVQATVFITAIDAKTRIVEFKGPRGNHYKVTAGPKIQLERLKVGDRLLATYAEALVVRLERAFPAP